MTETLAFIDLAAQRDRLRPRLDAAIARVLDHGEFIMGPEIKTFEAGLSAFAGLTHAISCANGTDALAMPLMVWGLKPGDAVFCPTFTFAATAEVVAWLGATPVFVDVDPDTFNLSLPSLEAAIDHVVKEGRLKPRAVIAVDLFGLPADYPAIRTICDRHGMKLIADAAQGFGGTLNGRQAGHWADVVATSFFPAKPLGCYGDGGAVLTNDADLAEGLRSVRVHGKGTDKYDNVRIGMNARLDTIQAAILIEKLAIFPEEIEARNVRARRYAERLGNAVKTPYVPPGAVSTWAQYTLVLDAGQRDEVAKRMKAQGVPTAVYYPRPLHQQTAYRRFPVGPGGAPVSERLAASVLSLPMHPYLSERDQDRVCSALHASLDARAVA